MNLKDNEFIFIKSYCCTIVEDDYSRGEIGGELREWNEHNIPIKNNYFKDIKSALQHILDLNNLKYIKSSWFVWGNEMEDDYGRFDYDALVNKGDLDATEEEIKKWTEDKEKLYNLHIVVYLCIGKDFEKEDLNNIQL